MQLLSELTEHSHGVMPGVLLQEGGHATSVPRNISHSVPSLQTQASHLPDTLRLGLATCTVWLVTVSWAAPVSVTRLVLRTETWVRSPESRICGSGILVLIL